MGRSLSRRDVERSRPSRNSGHAARDVRRHATGRHVVLGSRRERRMVPPGVRQPMDVRPSRPAGMRVGRRRMPLRPGPSADAGRSWTSSAVHVTLQAIGWSAADILTGYSLKFSPPSRSLVVEIPSSSTRTSQPLNGRPDTLTGYSITARCSRPPNSRLPSASPYRFAGVGSRSRD